MCETCGFPSSKHGLALLRRDVLAFGLGAAALSAAPAFLAPAFVTSAWAKEPGPPPKPQNVVSPAEALARLKAGNQRYVYGVAKRHDFVAERGALVGGQNPFAGILSCADSRVAPEYAFDTSRGDLFVVGVLAFSAHKICGPTGIGILYGRKESLDSMPPFLGGGDMIKRVHLRSFTSNELPYKFEAGTPAIAEAVGLGAAVDYLSAVGMPAIAAHEQEIVSYALERLEEIPGVWIFGPEAEHKGGVVSFTLDGVHPHDISQILDAQGVAIRAGHHCAMPLHEKFGLPATARASFYLYTTHEKIDRLATSLNKVIEIFRL